MPQLNQLTEVALSQFFWLLLVLGLIYFGIGKAMLPKIQSTVDLREKRISDDLAAAEAARAAADKSEADYRERLDASRAEAARVTRGGGPVILVQSLYSGRLGYAWHRAREFAWTIVAFHVSKLVGYVPREATFAMRTRRFYTEAELGRDVAAAGLCVRRRRERGILPGRALVVAAWMLERDA